MPVPIAEETFGVRLRRLRTEAGLSIAEFAERTKYSKGYISKIETGAKPPNPELARCCDDALEASGALAELAPEETGGPAEAVAAVAAGMGAGAAGDALPADALDTARETFAAESPATGPSPTADAPPTTGNPERDTHAAEGDVMAVEPTRVTLAGAFGHDDASPHIPAQNVGPSWPPEPPPVAVTTPLTEATPDGPFAEWSARPEESSAESLLSLSDPSREDATLPSAGREETTTEPPAAAPVADVSAVAESEAAPVAGTSHDTDALAGSESSTPAAELPTAQSAGPARVAGESVTAEAAAPEPPAAGKALALRDSSIPAQSPVPAEAPSRRRRLILAGLAALLVAVAVAGAFLLLHLAGDERPPTDGRVHPAVPAQQHEE